MVALHMLRSKIVPARGSTWMGDRAVSATYRASPRYGGVWAAFRAASPGLGPVGEIPRRGGPRLLLKELDGDPRRISRFASCWRGTARGMSRLLMAEAWSPVQIQL